MTTHKEPEKKSEVRDADEVIREYYEGSAEGAFREDGTQPVSSVRTRTAEDAARSAELSGGDVDAASDQGDVGPETVGGSNPTPDQDIVDDIGRAAGVTYQDNEPLKFGDKTAARDEQRWELNPASSEDYETRTAEAEHATPSPSETSPGQTESGTAKPGSNKSVGGRKGARGRPPG
jgi:Family of unknown function (DUF6335)